MKKILLIEDNLEVRENTAEILSLADYEVVTAKNGKEGAELAQKRPPAKAPHGAPGAEVSYDP